MSAGRQGRVRKKRPATGKGNEPAVVELVPAPGTILQVKFSTCVLHGSHRPTPLIAQLHHSFPKELQAKALGISVPTLETGVFDQTTVPVCGTGHDSVHELIRRILRGDVVPMTDKTAKLAMYAVTKYRAALPTPTPTP